MSKRTETLVIPIVERIPIDPGGPTVRIELKFHTSLICTYTLDVRERESNRSLPGFPANGDNTNPQDDSYELPPPASTNVGRSIWVSLSILDQVGEGGDYEIDLVVRQGTLEKGLVSTGKRKIKGNLKLELLVVVLTK